MAIIYYDRAALDTSDNLFDADTDYEIDWRVKHPAVRLNEEHPLYRIVRTAEDNKSVLELDEEQAYFLYLWVEKYKCDIVNEFGELIGQYDFKPIVDASYYRVQITGKKVKRISDQTIKEMAKVKMVENKLKSENAQAEEAEEEA